MKFIRVCADHARKLAAAYRPQQTRPGRRTRILTYNQTQGGAHTHASRPKERELWQRHFKDRKRGNRATRNTSFKMARAIRGLRMAVVLVVEDEEQVRVLAESYLEEQGHQVFSAGSPQGAIAVLEKTPHVDLVFTDLDLKGDIAAGVKLAREALGRWPHQKVLYTTGRVLTDGMEAQFVKNSAFLAKPYTVEELLTTLTVHFKISSQPGDKS